MNKEVKLKARDILSHLILQDRATAMKIADTPEWEGGKGILEMDIKVNGVTVDTEIFRKVMEDMWQQANDNARDSVDTDKYQERVQEAAKKIVQDRAEGLMEAMESLQDKLHSSDDLIKWNWEE